MSLLKDLTTSEALHHLLARIEELETKLFGEHKSPQPPAPPAAEPAPEAPAAEPEAAPEGAKAE